MTPRDLLTTLFNAAVEAAKPDQGIRKFLPAVPKGRTIVIGAGKGAAQLARALEDAWPGNSRALSSRGTATPPPARRSRLWKRLTPCRMRPGSRPPPDYSNLRAI